MEKKCIIYRKQRSVPSVTFYESDENKLYNILGYIYRCDTVWAILEDLLEHTLTEIPISWIKIVD
jgi:hypothetical protein